MTTDAEHRSDPFQLDRFVSAQEPIYAEALREIQAGEKETHWMWFVFPQVAGLGRSSTAQHYAIGSIDEARAYLAHPVLGPRLRECAATVLQVQGQSALDIFGDLDEVKLRASMTLFAMVTERDTVFREVLDRYFGGEPDPMTLQFLERDGAGE